MTRTFRVGQFAPLALVFLAYTAPLPAQSTNHFRVYSHWLEPHEHPDYERRAVKPPDWHTFGDQTQFTCLRGFNVQDEQIVGYAEEMEKFTRTHRLGKVIWPSYPILFAKNLGDLADEIKRRGLYLFDIWGYVPGSGPGGYWQQFRPPRDAFSILESTLGERWLGTDIGEQDGRYIGGYANQMTPASANRFEQYLQFQRHFERMGDDLGHKHATLVSLNFGHYFLKEGTYTLIGAETAQALPNNQVYYAFIRGAGKQYGVPWFGNASIFNRWGFKTYGSSGRSDGYSHGPTEGTSLSLLKRLLYTHILYNSVAVGFENGWFDGEKLSPIGRIQQAAQEWVQANGQPGVMHTPVALLLDFYSGWSFPRHLYSGNLYRVWGNLPYEPGDYLTDGVLDLLYPGYQDSSYYHDESGFISPTPYGDIADCLLSDAPLYLLQRYPILVAAGELNGGRELRDKLARYVQSGGHLLLTSGNLEKLPGGLAGLTRTAAVLSTNWGQGQLTLLGAGFGVDLQSSEREVLRSDVDKPLAKPYTLRSETRRALETVLAQQQLFDAGASLSLVTCRKGPGEFTVGVANNSWRELPLHITSRCGEIQALRELTLDTSERAAVGYMPKGMEGQNLGQNAPASIAGGDIRIFAINVSEAGLESIAHTKPAPRPAGRGLPLRDPTAWIKREVLARPTFFEHFDTVIVNWRALHDREISALEQEAGWVSRQGLRVVVDASPDINLYPGLRLVDNLEADYAASLAALRDVLSKMKILAAHDLVLSLHRHPENNFTGAQTDAAFVRTLGTLAQTAAGAQITLHLRLAFGKPPWSLAEAGALLNKVAAPNLRLAVSTALLAQTARTDDTARILKDKLGVWLVAAPRSDAAGKLWDAHAPIAEAPEAPEIGAWLATQQQAPRLFDAVYPDRDAEYLDAIALQKLEGNQP
jgi:hypothetical protein